MVSSQSCEPLGGEPVLRDSWVAATYSSYTLWRCFLCVAVSLSLTSLCRDEAPHRFPGPAPWGISRV